MSVNQSHAQGVRGIILYNGERILLLADDVRFGLSDIQPTDYKGEWKGKLYLTTHRIIYLNDNLKDSKLKSFNIPFTCMRNVELEQPIFGANHIKGKVLPETNAGWSGEARFKLWFFSGGAIEFGQAMMKAGQLALRNRTSQLPQNTAYNYENTYAAPPPAYSLCCGDPNYGWLPYSVFPTAPTASDVYMVDAPPPYPGVVNTPYYAPPGNASTQSMPAAYYDPNNPHTAYVQPSAPPAYGEVEHTDMEKKKL